MSRLVSRETASSVLLQMVLCGQERRNNTVHCLTFIFISIRDLFQSTLTGPLLNKAPKQDLIYISAFHIL